MPKKKSSQKLSPLEIARLLSKYDDANRSTIIRYQRFISAFDIPLILDLICSTLTSDELWTCRRVCRTWHALFERPLWHAVRLTPVYCDRKIQLSETNRTFFQERAPWIKRATVNVTDLQLADMGCSQIQHLQVRHWFHEVDWPYDDFFEDLAENGDDDNEAEDEGSNRDEEADQDPQPSEDGVIPSALSLIGMNSRLSYLFLDWDMRCRTFLSQTILDQFMQLPVLTEFELRIQHWAHFEDVQLWFAHCPLSVKELRFRYWGLFSSESEEFETVDDIELPKGIVQRPFRPLPSLETLSIAGRRRDMEDQVLFPFLRDSCSHLQRIFVPVLDDSAVIQPKTVDSIMSPTAFTGMRAQDRSVQALLVSALINFCPLLKEYTFASPLPEHDLYRLVHGKPLMDAHHHHHQRQQQQPTPPISRPVKLIDWWISSQMNHRVIPTLVHNFGTTLETIRLHLIDFRPDVRFLNPRSDTFSSSLLSQEDIVMEEEAVVPRVPLQLIAEHTKLILRNCPVLKTLSVRQEWQSTINNIGRSILPRTGISLQDLLDTEWACSNSIKALELEIWDPPTPGPAAWSRNLPSIKTMSHRHDHRHDDNDEDDPAKEGNDSLHLDEEILYRPYADEATYLINCRLFSRWKTLLHARNEAQVDIRTAAEAASLAAKASRQQTRTLGPYSATLDQLLKTIQANYEDALEDAIAEAAQGDQLPEESKEAQRFVRCQWLVHRAIQTAQQIYQLFCRLKALPNLKTLNLTWLSPQHQMYLEDGLWLLQRCAADEEARVEDSKMRKHECGHDGSVKETEPAWEMDVRRRDLAWLNLEWTSRTIVQTHDKETHYSDLGIYARPLPTRDDLLQSEETPEAGDDIGTLSNMDPSAPDLDEDEYYGYDVFKSRSRDKRTQLSRMKKRDVS